MLEKLFDPQLVIFAVLTALVILITLIVLAVVSRRVRVLISEVDGLRREMKLVDEALKSVNTSLRAMGQKVTSADSADTSD